MIRIGLNDSVVAPRKGPSIAMAVHPKQEVLVPRPVTRLVEVETKLFKVIQPAANAPKVHPREIYRVNHPLVKAVSATSRTKMQSVHFCWDKVVTNIDCLPARQRVFECANGMPGPLLAQIRGLIVRDVSELSNAVENLVLFENSKFGPNSTYGFQHYFMERDVSEFHVTSGTELVTLHQCRVCISLEEGTIAFSQVLVQLVVDFEASLVTNHIKVYARGTDVMADMVELMFDKYKWVVPNVRVCFGPEKFNKRSKQAICPYCPKIKVLNVRCSAYLSHMAERHGVMANGELIANPVWIHNELKCTHCDETVKLLNEINGNPFIYYCRHWNLNKSSHRGAPSARYLVRYI